MRDGRGSVIGRPSLSAFCLVGVGSLPLASSGGLACLPWFGLACLRFLFPIFNLLRPFLGGVGIYHITTGFNSKSSAFLKRGIYLGVSMFIHSLGVVNFAGGCWVFAICLIYVCILAGGLPVNFPRIFQIFLGWSWVYPDWAILGG